MVAAADQEDAVLAVHGHARDVAMLEPLRQLLPALDDLVSHNRPPARFYSRCLARSGPIVYRGGAQGGVHVSRPDLATPTASPDDDAHYVAGGRRIAVS